MNRADAHLQHWLGHRNVLLEVLNAVPADKAKFKPWDGAMTLGQLAVHIAQSTDRFVNFIKSGEFSRSPAPEWSTLDDVKRIVKELTERTKAVLASLTDADLQAEREAAPMNLKGPAVMFLSGAIDHEVHHKGQLYVYARMAGCDTLPFFVSRTGA